MRIRPTCKSAEACTCARAGQKIACYLPTSSSPAAFGGDEKCSAAWLAFFGPLRAASAIEKGSRQASQAQKTDCVHREKRLTSSCCSNCAAIRQGQVRKSGHHLSRFLSGFQTSRAKLNHRSEPADLFAFGCDCRSFRRRRYFGPRPASKPDRDYAAGAWKFRRCDLPPRCPFPISGLPHLEEIPARDDGCRSRALRLRQ